MYYVKYYIEQRCTHWTFEASKMTFGHFDF